MRCIRDYTKFTVSLITIIFILFIINTLRISYKKINFVWDFKKDNNFGLDLEKDNKEDYEICQKGDLTIKTKEIENIQMKIEEEIEKGLSNEKNLEKKDWQIEIPAIDLIAPIAQDTTQEVMLEYVGHFTNTSFWKGNIGLAAHNRRISEKLF